MKQHISQNIHNPEQLEKLYRSDKTEFKKAFEVVFAENKQEEVLQFWNQRLNYQEEKTSLIAGPLFWLAFKLVILAGLIANISNLSWVKKEFFFTRNTSFIIIPFVSAYFLWKQELNINKKIFTAVLFLISACIGFAAAFLTKDFAKIYVTSILGAWGGCSISNIFI